jgi:hypothetical protein
MIPLLLLPKLFIAGGVFLGTLQIPPTTPIDNHTLLGEKIPSTQVVTRSCWGTPMLPDGKGGYSLIAPINKKFIEQSLWIPPVSGTRPLVEPPMVETNAAPAPLPSLPPASLPLPVTPSVPAATN